MKFFPFSLLLPVLLCFTLAANCQCLDWEKLISYKNVGFGSAVRDNAGNIFVPAGYWGPAQIEGHFFNRTDPSQAGLLLKYDKDFNLLWIVEMGGAMASNIQVDLKGNIILSGAFFGQYQDFGCFSFTGQPDYYQAFIMKLTNDGLPVWGVQSIGELGESIHKVEITKENNLVAIGGSEGSDFTFDGIPVEGFGDTDGFVTSLTEDGHVSWALGMGGLYDDPVGGNSIDQVTDLALDHEGNIIVSGQSGSFPFRLGNVTLPPNGTITNLFLAKLTSSGSVTWAKSYADSGGDSWWSVTTDQQNNVYFSGNFNESVTFGTHTLTSSGLSDIFVLKYNPAGDILGAMSAGSSGYDHNRTLLTDRNNNLVIGGYLQGESFQFGSFSSTGTTNSDVFIGVLDQNLNPLCLKTTSGSAFKGLSSLEIDTANNFAVTLGAFNGITDYGGKFAQSDAGSITSLVFLGNNDQYKENPKNEFSIDLGPDREICPGETFTLEATQTCGTTLRWSDGTTGTSIEVTQPGTYWLEAKNGAIAVMDEIEVTYRGKVLTTNLGPDRLICNGEVVTIDISNPDATSYLWNDGSTDPEKVISGPGSYWAQVHNECFQAQDDIKVTTVAALPELDLGEDQLVCPGTEIIAPVIPGFEVEWSDGTHGQSMIVNKTGSYVASIQNTCETRHDTIVVDVMSIENLELPNVVTADHNEKNDSFILPDVLMGSNLLIYNRWGTNVYQSASYQNDWSGEGLASGTYFYYLTNTCLEEPVKGTVHLLGAE